MPCSLGAYVSLEKSVPSPKKIFCNLKRQIINCKCGETMKQIWSLKKESFSIDKHAKYGDNSGQRGQHVQRAWGGKGLGVAKALK